MRIQPRQQILDVWRALLSTSYLDGSWRWGGRDGSNSISDAEQLLCLLHPMHEMEAFSLHDPDGTRSDVARVFSSVGVGVTRVPRFIVDIASEYFQRYTDADGEPLFTAGDYLRTTTFQNAKQAEGAASDVEVEVVDSYSVSITLSLEVLAFVKARENLETHNEYVKKLNDLRTSASLRLTGAMTGLLRSFVVNAMSPESESGQAVLGMLRQTDFTDAALMRLVRDRFATLRTQLQDVRLAVSEYSKPEYDQLFECGWTWGIADGSNAIDFVELRVASEPGLAHSRPYLYFTVRALDAIADLHSRRTRALDLLDPLQSRMAEALQLRWDLTQRYWSAIARFDPERWPLEDIPWRTSDGEESDYYSLLVVSVLIQDLLARPATDSSSFKIAAILEELARRGRITRRLKDQDPALTMHSPGIAFRLAGSESIRPDLAFHVYDYAALLLKRCVQAMRFTNGIEVREGLMAVAEAAMDHLSSRRLTQGPAAGLWDDIAGIWPISGKQSTEPSWYLTVRVMEALVETAHAYGQDPPQSVRMREHLIRLLNEADHLYNQELLQADADDFSALRSGLDEIEAMIARARSLQNQRISTGIALAERSLRLLDALAMARADAERGYW